MPPTPFDRRISRLLKDKRYGGPLAKLPKRDQKRVFDLVRDNRGKEARKTILELDETRRQRVRIASASRRRKERERRTVERIWRIKGVSAQESARRRAIQDRVKDMPDSDMSKMSRMKDVELDAFISKRARQQTAPGQTNWLNPFWYG